MIASVSWAAVAKYQDTPIFWPESIAIVAFAISWLVKGEAHWPLLRGAKKLMGGGDSPPG